MHPTRVITERESVSDACEHAPWLPPLRVRVCACMCLYISHLYVEQRDRPQGAQAWRAAKIAEIADVWRP